MSSHDILQRIYIEYKNTNFATNMTTIEKWIACLLAIETHLWFSSCTFFIYIPQGQISLFIIWYYLVDMIIILSINVPKIG